MTDITINSIEEFHRFIQSYNNSTVIFRGVPDRYYQLTPKIGRYGIPPNDLEKTEKSLLARFKEQSVAHVNFDLENDWEWMAIAQHHGLPTRLLDWSTNPLVATFFAVESNDKTDGAVYAYRLRHFINTQETPDPFNPGKLMKKYFPRHLSKRITAQAGLFTIHRKPSIPIDSIRMVRLIIPAIVKPIFQSMLFRYGINHSTLFPDIDGVARFLEWKLRFTRDQNAICS